MLAANSSALLTSGCRIACRGLSPLQATRSNLLQCQQVRFARKTFLLKTHYGLAPLYTDNQYEQTIEEGQLDELSFKQIRFNLLWETNSPLQDDVLERYLRYMLRGGRRNLMYSLLHDTFYEIKTIQYKRYRKMLERQANGDKTKKNKAVLEVDGEESEETVELDPMKLFHKAIDNCKPYVITSKIKRGGAVYQVPTPVGASKSEWLAMKWLNDLVKDRPKPRVRHYHEELAQEILDASQMRGKVVKKKDDLHKLAQANKAYSHYRWG